MARHSHEELKRMGADLDALFQPSNEPDPFLASEAVDLSTVPAEKWERFCRVVPTPGVARYAASGDKLTHKVIDLMEMALEQHYRVEDPWYITSERSGDEKDGTLKPEYFYLDRE